MIQDRVDFIETTPNVTRSQHVRIVAFICLLIGIDFVLLHYALASTLSKGVSINLLFAFEYAIQFSTALATLCKYTLSVIDMAMEGRWQGKGVAVFYLELALDLLHLITYTVFFAAVFTTYGIPIHLVRDLYWTFRNFQTRVRDFLRYRQVAAIMEHRFPDATVEDLARADHVCIVCREEMGPGSRAKRLDCSHCFHVHCLRSWLERQQNCPICRAPVLASVNSTTRRNARRGVHRGLQGVAENNNDLNNRPAEGEAAAAPGGHQHVAGAGAPAAAPAADGDNDNGRMLDLHALLGLDDEFINDHGGPVPAGRQAAAAGTGLRWRGPHQQQNGNAGGEEAAGGGGGQPPLHPMQQQQQHPYGMYPYNIMHPHQQQQQYQYGYPYTMPPFFAFPQQQQQQQMQMPPAAIPNAAEQSNGGGQSTPASPIPQQQQPQSFTAVGAGTSAGAEQLQQQQQQHPFIGPSFFPIPVFIPMMASPGPHTPGGQNQQQQATADQHALAAALAAAATAAATMSAPFIMPSPCPMPDSVQHTDINGSVPGPSSSTFPPVTREEQTQQDQTQAAPPPQPVVVPPPSPRTGPDTTPAPEANTHDDDDDEAEQIRRRRLERFQNGASGSRASDL